MPSAISATATERLPLLSAHLREIVARIADPVAAPLILEWLAAFAGPALMIGLIASIAGATVVWRNCIALAPGFATASAYRLEPGRPNIALARVAMAFVVARGGRSAASTLPLHFCARARRAPSAAR